MKKTFTIIVLSFFCFSVFGQPIIPDTIYNIQWELLDAPSGQATSFAKQGNRLFAAPHFYSDDMGENWNRVNNVFGMQEVVASDDVILFRLNRRRDIHARSIGDEINIIRSTDGGESFEMVWTDIIADEICTKTYSRLYKKNDTTFFFTVNRERCFTTHFNETRLIFTNDAGLTWQEKPLAIDNITVKDNIIYGHRGGSTIIFENDDFEPTRYDNSTGFFQYRHVNDGGDVYTLDRLNENIRIHREGIGFEQEIALPFHPDDETIGQFELVNNSIFIATNKKVYEMKLFPPYEIDPIFTASFPDDESLLIFGILEGVWFVNDKDGVHRSFDDGITWEQKTKGFTNPDEYNFEMLGDRFWIGKNLFDRNFWFLGYKDVRRSSPDLDTWENVREPIFSDLKFLGFAAGAIFAIRISDNQVLRSFDDGESWEEVSVDIVHNLYHIFEDRNRVFLYNTSITAFSNIEFYSDDGGSSWTEFKGGFGENVAFGDTFVSFVDSIRYLSQDRGETWNVDTININIPVEINHNEIYRKGDTLFVFVDNQMAFSIDKGKVWIKTLEIPDNYPSRLVGWDPIPATVKGNVNGLVIVNSDASMYVTKNFGIDWKVIKDVPFGDTLHGGWQTFDNFIEGSGQYVYKDGYLYCYTRGHGLWRTDFEKIMNELPSFNGFGKVTGRIYSDINNNCSYDPLVDVPFANHLIEVSNIILSTDSEGIYSTLANAGNLDVKTTIPPYHNSICTGGDIVSISLLLDSTQKVDFPLSPQLGINDVKVSLSASQRPRPGFKNIFRLTVKNIGTEPVSGVPITFTFNPDHYLFIDAPGGDH